LLFMLAARSALSFDRGEAERQRIRRNELQA
jgi:hypothetical protein